MKTPICAKCGSHRTSRREREGFLQKTLLSGLGFYPWECNSCWQRFFCAERGHKARPGERRSRNQETGEASIPETSGR